MLSTTACQLSEPLDDYKPLYSLDADNAIKNEASAELALTGVYSGFLQGSTNTGMPMLVLVPDIMSGYSINGTSSNSAEDVGLATNNPIATGAKRTQDIYALLYDIVNRSNWIIEKTTALGDNVFTTAGRKAEIIAEGKIMRALADFYLLRNFGQFYNINSEYGIVLRNSPVRDNIIPPRSTVAQTYASILADLDEGIANAPDLRSKKYTSKTFAKALKARVLLYMGKYQEAANLCQDVINASNANFRLATTYTEFFLDHTTTTIFSNPEILFGTAGEGSLGIGIGNNYSGTYAKMAQSYKDALAQTINVGGQTIICDNGIRNNSFPTNSKYGGFYTTKYRSNFVSGTNEMFYQMRMAEVYLILAEASARANNVVTEQALKAINTIRTRAGAKATGGNGFEIYPSNMTLSEFLKAVRYEKLAELYAEGGETWYDLIRYDYIDGGFSGGFKVSDVKASATNPDKFILPIPTESIDAGGKTVKQNPSY